MNTRAASSVFVVLLLLSGLPLSTHEPTPSILEPRSDLFDGFFVGENEDVWNQTPWPGIAVPDGFSYGSVIDYSDVGVLINNLSAESRTIGWAFVAARNISLDRVFVFNETGTPTGETINRNQFTTFFALPFLEMLQNRSSSSGLNYLVTTKGIPLRVSGGNDKASFDQELALLGGSYNGSIGSNYWFNHDYGPLAGKPMESFTRSKYGFFLVTRLTGYTVDTALELIERANNSLGQRGTYVLDLATNRNNSGYKFWNDDLYDANTSLNGSMGLPVLFDEETPFVTNVSNVMGYASWGSNDGNWYQNFLPNGGFDTMDAAWLGGSRYWTVSGPSVAPGDAFNWSFQSDTKQGGAGAFEAALETACSQDSGRLMQGIYGEYFDNTGVSFNAASMPSLIDRSPDRIQIEPHLNHGASNNAYPGLDARFKQDWGARFSGLIDVPFDGNWSFFLNSDDGSELWVNGESLVQNYGMHGMQEVSGWVNLTAGLHEFRIEFFQGGGPHGLVFSWQGPNTSKAAIPASAFYVASSTPPAEEALLHRWSFEDAGGMMANDSVANGSNFSLYGMNNSNWRTCVDGSCLWFDGVNDYVNVDVDDWFGNLTVSQWVWANSTNQTSYASTFAVDDQAGSNLSFQHMVSNSKWYLHNNQSRLFGDVVDQRWTHLVTVLDNGNIRQYMDGVLVNTDTYPNGSLTNIDLYKLGVNRAGSAFFEGMIDEVMVWDTALEDQDITTLRRNIIDNCTSYSGAGSGVANLTTTFTLPADLTGHAWVAYVYGQREGEVNGDFRLNIEALDSNGSLRSTNTSSGRTFTTSWAAETMRFRPDAGATQLKITVEIDIDSTSTGGSFFIDTVLMRAIRPHMDWVNGSIADTAVSTGGRSFNWGTAYGQSLVADLLEDGVSGVKGYVYEPYLTAVGLPSVYLTSYASGYNLAESHAAANRLSGWMGVVVGDPKMAPYADIFHDINVADVRLVGDANLGQPTTVQILVENVGMSASNGTLLVQTVLGNTVLNQTNLQLPAGHLDGSRTTVNLTIIPPTSGLLDLRIRYNNHSNERVFSNNLRSFTVEVNEPPTITDLYCSASAVTRGSYTICTVEANDDENVTSATLEWQIVGENASINDTEWNLIQLGNIGQRWEASLVVPTNADVGSIVLRGSVFDRQGMVHRMVVPNATRVVDAPQTWYGPHATDVDSPTWNNASSLANRPPIGLQRGTVHTLTACVADADYDPFAPSPTFVASRGNLSSTTYHPQSAANLYCYSSELHLAIGSSLEDVNIQVRNDGGSLVAQRTLRVGDSAPTVTLTVESDEGVGLDRVVGNGRENIVIQLQDTDDPGAPFIGNVFVQWPGSEAIELPLDVASGENTTMVPLEQLQVPLEAGELVVRVEGTGLHGSTATAELTLPFILTPPDVLHAAACDANGPVQNMTFGQVATLTVDVSSDRPLQSSSAQLTQLGWAINAPSTLEPAWGNTAPPEGCTGLIPPAQDVTRLMFRLKLDNSLVDGPGKAFFSLADIDGLVKSSSIDLMFQHAPTTLYDVETTQAKPGTDVFVNASIEDLDGLESVICSFSLYQEDGALATQATTIAGPEGFFVNQLSWQYPVPTSQANTTMTYNISCVDDLGKSFTHQSSVNVGPLESCTGCQGDNSTVEPAAEPGPSTVSPMIILALAVIAAVLVGTAMALRRRQKSTKDEIDWTTGSDDMGHESMENLFDQHAINDGLSEWATGSEVLQAVPDGWTPADYRRWLEGPVPEGWTEQQWKERVEAHLPAMVAHLESLEG